MSAEAIYGCFTIFQSLGWKSRHYSAMRQMRTKSLRAVLCVAASAALLLWPAFLNGYPLMFGDSGVYLEDGVTLHAGWARPLFYGLFMVPLHLKLTAWPVVIAQALLSVLLIRLTLSRFVGVSRELVQFGVIAVLAAATSLPWFASQIMPDVFGPLIVLALALVILVPERLTRLLHLLLLLLAAGLVMTHQSYVPLAAAIAVVLLILRWLTARRLRLTEIGRGLAVPVLAVLGLVAANTVFLGRMSLSPYGSIFPMARMMMEGEGQRTLERECPRPDWTMCSQVGRIPATFEEFLFGQDGTLSRAGGYKVVAAQSGAIIESTIKTEPATVARHMARRVLEQLGSFATGDWLDRPMPSVITAWENVFPPSEVARFKAGRQVRDMPLVSDTLQLFHRIVGFAALAVLVAGAASVVWRRTPLRSLLSTFAVALVVNAAVTGGLSGVYDRYQSRFVWLAVLASTMLILSARAVGRGDAGYLLSPRLSAMGSKASTARPSSGMSSEG
jgi:hypothetical protein